MPLQYCGSQNGPRYTVYPHSLAQHVNSHVEAAASSSSAHFGVSHVEQLQAHHPEPKSCILIGHQLQGGYAVHLVQCLCNVKRERIPTAGNML